MAARGGIKAAKAYAELYADDTKLTAGLKKAQVKLQAFAKQVTAVGTKMVKLAAIGAAPLALGTAAAAKFGKQMAMVSTMVDEPQKHMSQFTAGIKKMSVEMGESTETLSRGLYDILSASIEPAKAMDVLQVASKAAKAGLTDTGVAADAITTALNAYQYEASRAGEVSDVLFQIVKNGKTTFAELAPSIGGVISTAASAGVSLEEMGAMISTLTRNGVQTAEAVTAVNRTILSFMKPTEQASAAAEKMGLKLNTATLGAKGLVGVFEMMQNMDPEQIAEIFPNVRAIKGVIPAMRDLTGMKDDLQEMQNAGGSTEEQFGKMADTMMHKFAQLKEAITIVGVEIGTALVDMVSNGAKSIKDIATDIAAWIKENKELIQTFAKIVLYVGGIGLALLAAGKIIAMIVTVIGFAVSAVKMLNSAFLLMSANPVVIILGVIAAAIGGIIYLAKKLASSSYLSVDAAKERLGIERDLGKEAQKRLDDTNKRLGAEKQINDELKKRYNMTTTPEAKYDADSSRQDLEGMIGKLEGEVKKVGEEKERAQKKADPVKYLDQTFKDMDRAFATAEQDMKNKIAVEQKNIDVAKEQVKEHEFYAKKLKQDEYVAFGSRGITDRKEQEKTYRHAMKVLEQGKKDIASGELSPEQQKSFEKHYAGVERRVALMKSVLGRKDRMDAVGTGSDKTIQGWKNRQAAAEKRQRQTVDRFRDVTNRYNSIVKNEGNLRAAAEAEKQKIEKKASVKKAREDLARHRKEQKRALEEVKKRTGYQDEELAGLFLRYEKFLEAKGDPGGETMSFEQFVKKSTEGAKRFEEGWKDWTTSVSSGGGYFGLGFGSGVKTTEEHLQDIADNTAELVDASKKRSVPTWQ